MNNKKEKSRVDKFLDIPFMLRIADAIIKEDRKLLEELAKIERAEREGHRAKPL